MNTEQYEAKLRAREHELLETMQRYDEEARESRVSEVEDVMNAVTSSIGKATAFEEALSQRNRCSMCKLRYRESRMERTGGASIVDAKSSRRAWKPSLGPPIA